MSDNDNDDLPYPAHWVTARTAAGVQDRTPEPEEDENAYPATWATARNPITYRLPTKEN